MIDLDKIKKVHFIGIGGIGVSAIARMLSLEGKEVTGSDASFSPVTEELNNIGIVVKKGHDSKNVDESTELVVRTIAVPDENPEVVEAKKLSIPVISYPEMLGIVSKDKYTIAISGTHGKTTTTAMVAKILKDNGMDPTVIVGSMLKEERSNFIAGKGPYLVVEACEYRRSFLNINPRIVVITNIDEDHLDYYKDIKDIQSAFRDFADKPKKEDYVIADVLGFNVRPVISDVAAKLVDYSCYKEMSFELGVPGAHNKSNAAAAIAVAHVLGIPPRKAAESLKDFKGTWRRFEYKGETSGGVKVYDDYAHHPTEIKATLAAARQMYPAGKIVVAFQPHLFSRTKDHLHEFASAFSQVDKVLLAPIYAAREVDDGTISSQILKEVMGEHSSDVHVFNSLEELKAYAEETLQKGDVFMTMGAGNIYEIGEQIIKA
ncbi:MAG: UDP-N-acetylmuramate--L-alanine ligase [bacterium]